LARAFPQTLERERNFVSFISVSQAKGFNRPALLAALAVTGVVLLLERVGALESFEGTLLDARFAMARSTGSPLDEGLCFVAIDDGSIDTIGRWPWPYSVQAIAIEEIHRCGARVIAFDILYESPSQQEGEDEALAAAIGACRGVVGANSDPRDPFGSGASDPSSDSPLGRLLEVLGTSLRTPNDEAAERAGLDDQWRDRLDAESSRLRERVAWLRLRQLASQGNPPASLADFEAALGVLSGEDTSAERNRVRRVWDRELAWAALSRWMPSTTARPSPIDAPPILPVARAAGGVGLVFGVDDRDGMMRRVLPFMPTPGGNCLQLGVAAAAKYLDIDPRTVRVEGAQLVVGDRRIPLHHGSIVIDWPTAMFEGTRVLRGGGMQRPTVPIASLVELKREREKLAQNEERYRSVAQSIAEWLRLPIDGMQSLPVPESLLGEALESIEFQLPGVLDKGFEALGPEPSEDERNLASHVILWSKLLKEVVRARHDLAQRESLVRAAIEDRLVFVGFHATAVAADVRNTPFGTGTPGVYVHAAVANMVIDRRGLMFAPAWTEPLATVLLGVVLAVIASGLTAGRGALAAFGALATYGTVAWLSFDMWSLVVPMSGPLLGGFGSWVAGVTFVAVTGQRERAKIIRQFRARVSSELVGLLTGNPDALSVGGAEREITVLFGDLAGFTTLSEQLGGPQVVFTLNRYMGALTRGLTARRAYVNKFLGDGLLAFWSAFGNEPDQCRLAVEAAHVCQEEVAALGEAPEFRDRPRIRLRLGIATGKAVVGDCGAPPDLNDYTAIGDVVNLASRLESANKQFGTSVLIDGNTAANAGEAAQCALLRLGRVVVVGQSVPVEVFALVDGAFSPEARSAIERAVVAFEGRNRETARSAWKSVVDSGAASIAKPFIAALDDSEDPLDGILRLRAK